MAAQFPKHWLGARSEWTLPGGQQGEVYLRRINTFLNYLRSPIPLLYLADLFLPHHSGMGRRGLRIFQRAVLSS